MNTNFIPAFPTWIADDSMSPGMTLRDYFAAFAMQGDWASGNAGSDKNGFEDDAKRYYRMADEMMEARK